MQLFALAFLYSVQLVAAITSTTIKACAVDNCLRAVIASNFLPDLSQPTAAPSSRNQSIQQLLPETSIAIVTATSTLLGTETDIVIVTSVQTGVVTVATTTSATVQGNAKRSVEVFSFPGYGIVTLGHALEVRQATVVPSAIPAYASPCSGSVRYSSACSCIGITQSTVTLSTPTGITSTTTRITTSTTAVITSSTTTSTTVLTISSTTSSTTVISTASVTAIPGHPDVPGFKESGCWNDLQYDYPGVAAVEYFVGSIEECASDCQGYTYFGLYDINQCVCGNDFDLVSEVDESNCNIPCTGNTNEFCGGPFVDAQGYPAWNFYSSTATAAAPGPT